MWEWRCPKDPKLIWEHHSKESALTSIALHVGGYEPLQVPPCLEIHEIEDTGVPCYVEDCEIPYVR